MQVIYWQYYEVHVSRNTDRKRKMLKDEKKHHSAMDESSSEQLFCKLGAVTFVV